MSTEEELLRLLHEYDKLGLDIAEALAKPHAIDNIRIATQMFFKDTGRYPHEIHSALETYLNNCRRQKILGQINYGSD